MNKKREALRRGLRSFIQDTSEELADLEGRPLHPFSEETEAGDETGAVSDVIVDAGPERAEPSRHKIQPESPAPRVPEVPVIQAPATGPPQAPPPPAQPAPPAVRQEEPPKAPPAPPLEAAAASTQERARIRDAAVPTPPARRPDEGSAAPPVAAKPKRRAPAPVRRRPRAPAEAWANGVSPAQVHARKGVCSAYFVNHDCWRVPDAYCNSALQVCITRECPIYHLHKDALEHRFAKKFKHLW